MLELILLSMVCAFISTTVADMKVFAWLRNIPRVGILFKCGYCLGFWVALGLVAGFRPSTGIWTGPVEFMIAWFLVAWFSGLQYLLSRALTRVGKV
jgi:hypothetical protein